MIELKTQLLFIFSPSGLLLFRSIALLMDTSQNDLEGATPSIRKRNGME